jgi:ribosome-binding factor A
MLCRGIIVVVRITQNSSTEIVEKIQRFGGHIRRYVVAKVALYFIPSMPASVHRKVVNAFKVIINLKHHLPGQ